MDYKEKYEQALERAKKWYYAPNVDKIPTYANRVIEEIFPELKESDDERIRKAILIYLDWLDGRKDYAPRGEYSIRDMIDWLEKQKGKDALIKELGEYKVKYTQKVIENGLEQQKLYDNSIENERIKKEIINAIHELKNIKNEKIDSKWLDWLEKQGSLKDIIDRYKDSWYNEGKIAGMAEGLTDDEKYQQGWHDALEKQGEKPFDYENATIIQKDFAPKKDISDFKAEDWYVSKVDGKIHNIHSDNIEPKFKVGDWIINKGHSFLIAAIEDDRYLFEIGGYTHEQLNWEYIENADKKYHLWSIKDAKDGDVLTVNGRPFIYCCSDDYKGNYCCIDSDGVYRTGLDFGFSGKTILPATKEQRELLFQKMRENGYI